MSAVAQAPQLPLLPVGLRVDVDTFRGTRDGVPALVELFAQHSVRASFFMSVGPDNMGRNLWRLLRPAFLAKMLRSKAASLYGWDVLLRGTAWPGPVIGDCLRDCVRLPHDAGHEVGLHAWDHYSWQMHVDRYSQAMQARHIQLGFDKLGNILGCAPQCSATAGWRSNEATLLAKQAFPFAYNSDCRGTAAFRPVVAGQVLIPQIPVTLPTYDELIGRDGVTDANYNARILDRMVPGRLNVYTIHAEVEGIALRERFAELLDLARERNICFQPLGDLDLGALPQYTLTRGELPGREGWLAVQGDAAAV
ncbi:MAG: 4-deoxy-4-formamido-L-arabinose-phosphoundecaprenol deformylase [Azonexus sp.]|uniref:4-deoxy-4-formamido-L-arabinose- phosphoundecaprenol deformylase n=1 Tax=Azonexus sp. TaxID=1872668 RepID=UPI002827E52F|nr:4-deoxy-4-formamido-L-arabinose-phosphoundecaprenol deformylase [Azonexus sp.]MDR0775157.1 4-deoxy-4-formamido-L-arabinose-phosphoundecaprenol deformylase [Azonexus sp.]